LRYPRPKASDGPFKETKRLWMRWRQNYEHEAERTLAPAPPGPREADLATRAATQREAATAGGPPLHQPWEQLPKRPHQL
jgi:hypothetical protein